MSEAAEYLGVDKRTVQRLIAQDHLRAYRVGPKLVRIDIADLEQLLKPVAAHEYTVMSSGGNGAA
ncbi:excisionase family DNA-binding protein [Mycobacterium sp. TJFP1]